MIHDGVMSERPARLLLAHNGSLPEQVAVARAESAMFGSGEKLKTQALTVILEEIDQDTVDAGISYLK